MQQLKAKGFEQPLLEAHWLISGVLGLSHSQIISEDQKELTADLKRLETASRRRLSGEPLAYILGRKDFYKSTFEVGPGVLIPRPETEMLVDRALQLFPERKQNLLLADFGAGSGCIGISILLERPLAQLVAIERSPEAASYLKKNIERHAQTERTTILLSSVEDLQQQDKFDLVVANPPYIANEDPQVQPTVRDYEPHQALYADQEGLGTAHAWIQVAAKALKRNGVLLMEIGATQAGAMRTKPWAQWGFLQPEIVKDLAGHPRMVVAIRR